MKPSTRIEEIKKKWVADNHAPDNFLVGNSTMDAWAIAMFLDEQYEKEGKVKEPKWPDKIVILTFLQDPILEARCNGWNDCLDACKQAWQDAQG